MQLVHGSLSLWQRLSLMVFASIIGLLGALAAYIFEALIALIHNLSFSQTINFYYNHTSYTPASPLGIFIILVPVAGAALVTWILSTFARDEKGLSVSIVMHAIHHNKGYINPKVSLAKIISSSITIGTGGSVGREGPFIQIGAALSSVLSNFAQLPVTSRCILIGCGAASIVTATFNAPLAGIAFAVESLLLNLGPTTLICLSIATITASIFKYVVSGSAPIFILHHTAYLHPELPVQTEIFYFTIVGIATGLFSWLFIISVYGFQDIFARLIKNAYIRHMTGMLCVGIIFYLLLVYTGHYYIEGIGFTVIQDILNTVILNPWLLLSIMLLKYLATCLTLGSGASGGIFSPALFMGAIFGGLLSMILINYFPSIEIDTTLLVLAGMTGMLAATSGALVTAVLLTIELAWYYHAALPLVITAVVAFLVRRLLLQDSIYTLKFTRMGIRLPQWP